MSALRRERTEDQPTPALVPRLRCSEPRDALDGFPPVLARTFELNEPRVPIGELGRGLGAARRRRECAEGRFDACRAEYDDAISVSIRRGPAEVSDVAEFRHSRWMEQSVGS